VNATIKYIQANKTITTTLHNKRGTQPYMAHSSNFRFCTQQKSKPHVSPHYFGVGQEYWQSLSYLPSTAQAASDKINANESHGKTQAILKADPPDFINT